MPVEPVTEVADNQPHERPDDEPTYDEALFKAAAGMNRAEAAELMDTGYGPAPSTARV